jgi:hypothetical protein
LIESGLSSSARSSASSQPGVPGMMIACASMRSVPALAFTRLRASAICRLVRNQSSGSSDGADEISAILVSLSR